MDTLYYARCVMKTVARNCEISGFTLAIKLGIQLIELLRWNCCGVFPSLAKDNLIRNVATVRNLIHIQEINLTMIQK